jgi:hypothetical protein
MKRDLPVPQPKRVVWKSQLTRGAFSPDAECGKTAPVGELE